MLIFIDNFQYRTGISFNVTIATFVLKQPLLADLIHVPLGLIGLIGACGILGFAENMSRPLSFLTSVTNIEVTSDNCF